MIYKETHALSEFEKEAVRLLWNNEYPKIIQQKSKAEFDEYLSQLKNKKHILILKENEVLGWYCDFIRNNELWFAMIIDAKMQGFGEGRKLIQKAKKRNKELNGWVVIENSYLKQNKKEYKSPIEFYKKLGFKIFLNKKLESNEMNAIKIQWKSEDQCH
ncbi:GNAT family N-acetyltransferase [uncultured Tenacibaculum sp.]|uniref:GNAT family N-acetyltransferase n=1 Tax=uncultured Tenacibaculum sp. TaxID=174713 RepID=UPI002632BC49|nr:GNAT family N-acetyltransferase [uncultured Tenacibaculum sp.]